MYFWSNGPKTMNEVERNLGFILRKFLVIKGQRYQIRDELIYRGYKVDVGVVEIRVDEDGEHKTPFIERVYKEIGL